jgi:hypothetical protein
LGASPPVRGVLVFEGLILGLRDVKALLSGGVAPCTPYLLGFLLGVNESTFVYCCYSDDVVVIVLLCW